VDPRAWASSFFFADRFFFSKRQHHVDRILDSNVINGLFDSVAAPRIKTHPFAALGASAPAVRY
jgi:hypothetical protein